MAPRSFTSFAGRQIQDVRFCARLKFFSRLSSFFCNSATRRGTGHYGLIGKAIFVQMFLVSITPSANRKRCGRDSTSSARPGAEDGDAADPA